MSFQSLFFLLLNRIDLFISISLSTSKFRYQFPNPAKPILSLSFQRTTISCYEFFPIFSRHYEEEGNEQYKNFLDSERLRSVPVEIKTKIIPIPRRQTRLPIEMIFYHYSITDSLCLFIPNHRSIQLQLSSPPSCH